MTETANGTDPCQENDSGHDDRDQDGHQVITGHQDRLVGYYPGDDLHAGATRALFWAHGISFLQQGFGYQVICDTAQVFLVDYAISEGLDICSKGFGKIALTRPHVLRQVQSVEKWIGR